MSDSNINFDLKFKGKAKITREILPVIDHKGDFHEVFGKDSLIVQIRNLLLTPLGTYPFDPEYGSLLFEQLFQLMNEPTKRQIEFEVKNRINMYIDGVIVTKVDVYWYEVRKSCTLDVYIKVLNEGDKTTKISLDIQNLGNTMYDSIDEAQYEGYML